MIEVLKRITRRDFIMPFYHAVSDKVPVHLKYLYRVRTVKQFEDDLEFLLLHYKPVSIDDVYSSLITKGRYPEKSFLLTFDDGLREFKEFAYPVIKKRGIPVALFVNSGFVDNKELFYRFKASVLIETLRNTNVERFKCIYDSLMVNTDKRNTVIDKVKQIDFKNKDILDQLAGCLGVDFNEYLKNNAPYLNVEELKELNDDGVHVGAHSINHPLFELLNDEERMFQIKESVDFVKNNFKNSLASFSFPFTDSGLSASFFRNIYDKKIADITFGTSGIKNERFKFHLQRIPVEEYEVSMKDILARQYLYYLLKVPFFRNTVRR
ncbi:MAG: polysaccharide deacetylase family protein [Chlorobi bacterium]|nr:polysaccharide deacetylase family protein [Chlorobiota bacterium]